MVILINHRSLHIHLQRHKGWRKHLSFPTDIPDGKGGHKEQSDTTNIKMPLKRSYQGSKPNHRWTTTTGLCYSPHHWCQPSITRKSQHLLPKNSFYRMAPHGTRDGRSLRETTWQPAKHHYTDTSSGYQLHTDLRGSPITYHLITDRHPRSIRS